MTRHLRLATHTTAAAGTDGTRSLWLLFTTIAALVALLAFAGNAGAATRTGGTGTDPWVSSDLPDYPAGATVNLLGGSWQPGESVHIAVNDAIGQTWSWSDDVSADTSGDISDSFTLPNWFVSNYAVTATGASGSVATTTFTDALGTTASVTSSANPSTEGQSVTFTATVTYAVSGSGHSVGDPVTVGTVRIGYGSNCQGGFSQIGGSGTPNASGQFAVTTSALAAAGSPYAIWACYAGTGGSTGTGGSDNRGTLSQTVNPATASISGTVYQDSNGNGSFDAGEPGISGVSVSLSGTSSATATTNGSGVYTFSNLAAGNYGVDYTVPNGYANIGTKPIASFAVSAGQAVTGKNFFARKQTSTSLARTAGVSPSTYGDSVTFTAAVTSGAGNPSGEGTVQFKDGANTITGCGAVSLTGNTASCAVSKLAVAGSPHSITAVYSGTTTGNGFGGSTSGSVSQSVAAKNLTVSGITASNKVYDGLLAATINTSSAALNGVVSGDTVTLNAGSASGAFLTKTVAAAKTVQISGLTLSGVDAGNYSLTQPTATADITAKNLTISGAVANDKTYDGNAAATVDFSGAGLVGVVSGDSVAIGSSAYSASFNNMNVASAKPVTVSGVGLSGSDAGNYTVSQPSGLTASISARNLTVTAHGVNKVYDGTPAATVTLTTDALSGDAVDGAYTSAAFANKNVGTNKPVGVSGISISGADAGNYSLSSTTASTTAEISARDLTVGASGVNKVYDGTSDATVSLSSDKLGGDALTLGYTSAAFNSKNVGTNKPVGVSGISISGADAGNYTLLNTTASTSADISARPITVTAVTDSKIYDGTVASGAAPVVTSGSIASGDAGNFSQAFATKTVGTAKSLVPSGSVWDGNGGNNYSVVFQNTTTGVITPKTLTVTGITAGNRPWDGTTAATLDTSGATLNGVVSGDAVTLGVSGATGAFSSSAVGTWTVQIAGLTISGADAGNYSLFQPTTTASITAWNASGKGFYAPVGVANSIFTPAPGLLPTTSSSTLWNTVKGGQTIPLKFNVYAGTVEKTSLTDIASFTQANVPCTTGNGQDPVDLTTTGNTSLRYDTTAMQWIQNWKTPAYSASQACWRATVRFADASTLSAFFQLTK